MHQCPHDRSMDHPLWWYIKMLLFTMNLTIVSAYIAIAMAARCKSIRIDVITGTSIVPMF